MGLKAVAKDTVGVGTVTSVAASFTGGLVSVGGSPITSSGTLAFTVAGTSGGIPYFSGASTWASSAALAANAVLLGGGEGNPPTSSSKLTESSTAGGGLSITAGTATTDVAALSVTRTNNNAAVATGVKIAFTDTTSAAGFLPFQVLGTSSGIDNLFSVGKANGAITLGSVTNPATTGIVFVGSSNSTALKVNSNGDQLSTSNTFLAGANVQLDAGVGFVGRSAGISARLGAGSIGYAFTSTGDGAGTVDTNLSRISAGVVGVGTGAAGSVAGGLHAGMLQASLGTALTLTQGAIGMSKMTASGSAPGASGLKLEVVCGTNAGSAKITALAGTSTTPVTVLDNIGSGVTGC